MQPERLLDCASRAEAWIGRRRLTIRMARRVLRSWRLSSAVISLPAKRILQVVGSINRTRQRASNQISMFPTVCNDSNPSDSPSPEPPPSSSLLAESHVTSARREKRAHLARHIRTLEASLAQAAANSSSWTRRYVYSIRKRTEIRSKRRTSGRCFAVGELPIVGELPKACLTILRGGDPFPGLTELGTPKSP
jgi:hypothetical protein